MFAPFGEVYENSGSETANFTGHFQDLDANLYDYEFREQSPVQGRWLNPDPSGMSASKIGDPQTLNRYSYVRNSAMAMTDPNGLRGLYGRGWWLSHLMSFGGDGGEDNMEVAGWYLDEVAQGQANLAKHPIPWSSLSASQQALVPNGEAGWGKLSVTQQSNYAAISQALEATQLSNGSTGLSEVTKVTEIGSTGIAVNWKEGADQAFNDSGFSWRPGWGHPGENGLTRGGLVTGLHLLFGDKNPLVGHVHIDYRNGYAEGHYKSYNSDVRAIGPETRIYTNHPINNYERYQSWYGAIPGYVP